MTTSREPFTSVADADDRHVGRYGAQLAAGLVEVADMRPDQRVLDGRYRPSGVGDRAKWEVAPATQFQREPSGG